MGLAESMVTADDPPKPRPEGDRTMRFKLYWRHPGETKEWCETHEEITADPVKWSRDIVAWFNSTLRPHEKAREFIRCEVEGEVTPAEHRWMKLTAMTRTMQGSARHGQHYDSMKCERCGVTGKRYGIGGHTRLDSKYRLKVYQRCDTTMAAQSRREIPS